jgi:hypothetical protein
MMQDKNDCMITGNPNSFNFCLTSILLSGGDSASTLLFLHTKPSPSCTYNILFAEVVFCYAV